MGRMNVPARPSSEEPAGKTSIAVAPDVIAKILPEYIDADIVNLSTGLSTSPDIATRVNPTVAYVFLVRASARRNLRKPQPCASPLTICSIYAPWEKSFEALEECGCASVAINDA
jgi:hypothetical protein